MADSVPLSPDDAALITRVKKRFTRAMDWEAQPRKLFVEDTKFARADPDNNWQWENELRSYRSGKKKPCLTINKTRQHNLQIINDARQNKPGVNIKPVGDGATYEAAQGFEGIVRHIEYQSNAESAYDTATVHQVEGGIGYWRVVTEYVGDDSFDQEIFIRRVKNPLACLIDPDIQEADGSDARFGFFFEDLPRDEFTALYPQYRDDAGTSVLGEAGDGWLSEDHVRVAEYYERAQKPDELIAVVDPSSGQIVSQSKRSEASAEFLAMVKRLRAENPDLVRSREILSDTVMWYKIAGSKKIDEREWPGKYIPIVRVIGEEAVIEGKLDRKGHTRYLKDAQRMYNYWTSEATAQVALQTKTPWIAPAESIENLEEYWKRQNIDDLPVLPYNQYDEDGTKEFNKPERQNPPVMATAYVQGMQIAQNELMMASGQYQSQFGQNENATSGKAINERQRQGDNATYHFIDNLAIAIRYTGKILIDLIPRIYDTRRVIRILAKDGTESRVQVDPQAQSAWQEVAQEEQEVAAIFNPNVGRYEVISDIGPGYATRRQEAFNAMTQIAAQNQEFMQVAGDLLWKVADFPEADTLAERWAKIIPDNIKGDGPSKSEQALMAQLKQAQDAVVQLQQKLDSKQLDYAIKIDQKNIDAFDADTRRLTAIGNAGPIVDGGQLQPLIAQTIMQMLTGGWPQTFGAPGGAPPTSAHPPQLPTVQPVQQAPAPGAFSQEIA